MTVPRVWICLFVWTAAATLTTSGATSTILYSKVNGTETLTCECPDNTCQEVFWYRYLEKNNSLEFLLYFNSAGTEKYSDIANKHRLRGSVSSGQKPIYTLRITGLQENEAGLYSCIFKMKIKIPVGYYIRPGVNPPTLHPPTVKTEKPKQSCRSCKPPKGGLIVKEEQEVPVNCVPTTSGTLVFWFRIKVDGPEFLFSSKGKDIKTEADQKYKVVPSGDNVHLVIRSFNKKTDSGVYACAAMNNNNLIFGEHTVVNGEVDPTQPPPPKIAPAPTKSKPAIATTQCACKKTESKPVLNCETWILSSLAAGCGLLLILLVITIFYCNRLRTRRCPHHYKRQPQNRPAGHAKLPNNNF